MQFIAMSEKMSNEQKEKPKMKTYNDIIERLSECDKVTDCFIIGIESGYIYANSYKIDGLNINFYKNGKIVARIFWFFIQEIIC